MTRCIFLCAPDSYITVLLFCPGKSGAVGKRLAASLSSVGVAATFVHAAEWGHGDLGKYVHSDMVMFVQPMHTTVCTKNVLYEKYLHNKF